jgi:hypothetical protein
VDTLWGMRIALALALLAGCGAPPDVPERDAGALEEDAASDPLDAGPAWARLGCVPVPTCIGYEGAVAYCPQVHEDPRDSWTCRRWLRCPYTADRDCFACREWSSDPRWTEPPEPVGSQGPECSEELCPVLDGGDRVPTCGDAGL